MNKRTLASLAVIAVLILLLVVVKTWRSDHVPVLKPWDDATDEIIIKKSDVSLIIQRKGDQWIAGDKGYRADSEIVAGMEKTLKELKISELITEKPHDERYELVSGKSILVRASSGKKILREIQIGKKSSTNRHTYIKLRKGPEVYLAVGNLRDQFGKSLDEIRDKVVMKIDANAIQELKIRWKGRTLTFQKIQEPSPKSNKQDGKTIKQPPRPLEKWVCREYGTVSLDQNMMGQIVSSLGSLRATSFADRQKKDLGGSICVVKVKKAGKWSELVVHKKHDKNGYICSSSESEYAFILSTSQAERYMKSIADLKDGNRR